MRFLRRTLIAGSAAALAGCAPPVTIENMNIHTVAVNCDVTRGSEDAGQIQGDANILAQAGAAAAAWAGQMHSVIRCPGGLEVEAGTEGNSATELQP